MAGQAACAYSCFLCPFEPLWLIVLPFHLAPPPHPFRFQTA